MVIPVLSFGNHHNHIIGSLGDTSSLSRGMAMAKRYGPATAMITITPDDINNPNSLRLAMRTINNKTFPAVVDEDFFAKLKEGSMYQGSGNVSVPLHYNNRHKLAAQNPVAVASEFLAVMEDILQVLIGCPLDFQPGSNSKQVRTWYFKAKSKNCPHHKGIFGHITAYFGCIETQARNALHFHLILWGGITPKLLQKATGFDELCTAIEEALDSMYSAEIPRNEHIKDLIYQKMKKTANGRSLIPNSYKIYPIMNKIPSPRNSSEWIKYHDKTKAKVGIHSHTFTCKKPPSGRHRCRGARPSGTKTSTGPIQLDINEDELYDALAKNEVSLNEIIPTVSTSLTLKKCSKWINHRNYQTSPVPNTDNRLIVWELKRPALEGFPPLDSKVMRIFSTAKEKCFQNQNEIQHSTDLENCKDFCINEICSAIANTSSKENITNREEEDAKNDALERISLWLKSIQSIGVIDIYLSMDEAIKSRNGYVVESNVALHNTTGSCTNAIFLGNAQQSSAAFFYVAPYICKTKVALESCIGAIDSAQKHIDKYKSRASDSGTDKRYVQHMFTRVLNDLSTSICVSDTQVALSLLEMGTEINSDSFRYFGAEYSINFFTYNIHHNYYNNNLGQEGNTLEEGYTSNDTFSDTIFDSDDLVGIESNNKFSDSDDDDMISHNGSNCSDTSVYDKHTEIAGPQECIPAHDSTLYNKDFGPAIFYKVSTKSNETDGTILSDDDEEDNDFQSVPIHYPAHWFYRGKDLCQLTQFEYYALVDILPLSKISRDNYKSSNINDSTDEHERPGRAKRKPFYFHERHPLHKSHAQVLRSKQHTLIFNA